MREVSAREVLATGLRRAIDPRVIALSAIAAIAGVALLSLLHMAGLESTDPHDSVARIGAAQARTLITLVPSALGSAATLRVVVALERSEPLALGTVLRRFHLVYLAQLFASFALGFGIACFIVPALWVGVVISLMTPVVVEEGVGPLVGWGRCRQLIENRGDTVTGVVVTTWVVMVLVICICLVPFVWDRDFTTIVRSFNTMRDAELDLGLTLARSAYGAIWAGVTGVLYVRLRERELPSEAEKIARVFA